MSWWSPRFLRCIDFRIVPLILVLMAISVHVIAMNDPQGYNEEIFFTHRVVGQLRWFAVGVLVYLFTACLDYTILRRWAWLFYLGTILALVGLFFTDSIQRVNRWYRVPFIGFFLQPSEVAKLVVVITLSWFLEQRKGSSNRWTTAFWGGVIVGIPFILIYKQPDLGTALILYPITLVMFYFGDVYPPITRFMSILGIVILAIALLFLLGVVSHDEMRPYATAVLKDYQYDRLDPNKHHQQAALTAIAIGGFTGVGWHKSEFSGRGWLPMAQTDSVFPALGEEFGFIGLVLLLALFYTLIYFSVQVSAVAKDHFGRLLSAGITVYLAMHILMNIGMMCGLLPITGVPLILITYGGSSVLVTMAALGLLQSIYSRRFVF